MTEADGIPLADALEVLRSELAVACQTAAGKPVQFLIEKMTVELKVGITRSADGRAGFKVPLLGAEIGASAGAAQESVQMVTVVLGPPVDQDGNPIKVASASEERKD